MILKLCQAGQPVLRARAKLLTKKALASQRTQDVIDFMIATLRDAPGVGLAAPQVGESLQIIIIEDLAKYHEIVPAELLSEQGRIPVELSVLVNPTLEIIPSETAFYFEGCLSVDGYCAAVTRATSVRVTAMDRNGKPVSYLASGWKARILQHEIDHLQGTLYIDVMNQQSFMTVKYFGLEWRKKLTAAISTEFNP